MSSKWAWLATRPAATAHFVRTSGLLSKGIQRPTLELPSDPDIDQFKLCMRQDDGWIQRHKGRASVEDVDYNLDKRSLNRDIDDVINEYVVSLQLLARDLTETTSCTHTVRLDTCNDTSSILYTSPNIPLVFCQGPGVSFGCSTSPS